MSKGNLRNINVKGVEWKYIIEHDVDRKAEVRMYKHGTKQIIKRIEFSELGFDGYEIEHGGCNITPGMIRKYIQDNLNKDENNTGI